MGKSFIIKGADYLDVAINLSELSAPTIVISESGIVTITSYNAKSIYYTTDGSSPTTSSTLYNGEFEVNNGTIINAISLYDGGVSGVSSKQYTASTAEIVIDFATANVVYYNLANNNGYFAIRNGGAAGSNVYEIPLTGQTRMTIVANASNRSRVIFTKEKIVSTTEADNTLLADGTLAGSFFDCIAGSTTTITIPTNAGYAYIQYLTSSGVDWTPQSVVMS